jgi:hypothetical protein
VLLASYICPRSVTLNFLALQWAKYRARVNVHNLADDVIVYCLLKASEELFEGDCDR